MTYLEEKKGIQKGEINELLGNKVVSIIKNGVQNVFTEDGKLKKRPTVNNDVEVSNFPNETKMLITYIYMIAFHWGLNKDYHTYEDLYDEVNNEIGPSSIINRLSADSRIKEMLQEKVSADRRKQFKDKINDNINYALDENYFGGKNIYQRMIAQGQQKRAKREQIYEANYRLKPTIPELNTNDLSI